MPEPQRSRTKKIAAGPFARRSLGALAGCHKMAHQLIESLGGAPVFLALIRRQFERHHRNRQIECFGQTARIILDELGRAGSANDHRLGREALVGFARSGLEKLGGIATQIAGLEGGVGHRWALRQALDHGEQQIGVGIALRRMQDVMQAAHCGGDTHGADMRRAFISPECELHGGALRQRSWCVDAADAKRVRRGRRPGRNPESA